MLANSVTNTQTVEIIAHRGASYDAPENTLASLRLGWEQEADGVEFDIHLSKDSHIVVFHDRDTVRMGGSTQHIASQTLEELRRLDVGSWKDARFAGERIPTLDEAIATLPADTSKRVVIEVKCGPEVIPALEACLARSGKSVRQLLLICSPYETMRAIKSALPQYEMYWLSEYKYNQELLEWPLRIEQIIGLAQDAGIEGLNLDADVLLGTDFLPKVKAAGLKCYTWTVDQPEDAQRLIAAGVAGITTNRPLWLRQQLAAS